MEGDGWVEIGVMVFLVNFSICFFVGLEKDGFEY